MSNTKHIILGMIILSFVGCYFACKPIQYQTPKQEAIKPLKPIVPVAKQSKFTLNQLIETL